MATSTTLSGPALNNLNSFNGTEANAFQKLVQELVSQQIAQELRSRMVHLVPGNYVPGQFVKGTDRIRYVRYPDISHNLTELNEGVTPDPTVNLSVTTEYFSVKQYGSYTSLSDIAQLDSPHDLVSIAAERVSFAAAKSMDAIVRDVMNAGSARVYYASKFTDGAAVTTRLGLADGTVSNAGTDAARQDYKLNGLEVKKAVARLKAANVPPFPDGFYRCIIHPNQQFDLLTDTSGHGFLEATKYTQPLDMLSGEIGAYSGVRFLVANDAKTFTQTNTASASITIYSALFFGPDAFVVGDSQTMQTYFVAPGGDHTDPLSQRALIGYKLRFGAMIMGEAGVSEYSGRDKAAVVTKFSRTTTNGVLTTSGPHGLFVGETVRIRDVDALVNYASVGEKVITAVTTTAPHTFTVAVATGTTAEVTVTGLVENKVPQTSLGQVRYLRLETRATAL
jgi:N4-gp56 family major capsid protein